MKRIITGVLAVAAALLTAALPAHAAIGTLHPVQATCEYGRITVTSPQMGPAYNIAVASDGTLIADPPQWVRFRPHAARWNEATGRWAHYAAGDWKAYQATHTGTNIADTWLNLRTNRWEAGTTTFQIAHRGYYRVYAEYYWYAQFGVAAGYLSQYTPYQADLMAGGYMGWGDPWCHYR